MSSKAEAIGGRNALRVSALLLLPALLLYCLLLFRLKPWSTLPQK